VSKFIDDSIHKDFTASVTEHFFGNNVGAMPGQDRLLKAAPYGSSAWNTPNPPSQAEQGLNNTVDPASPGVSLFNDSSTRNKLPRETGVNYKPEVRAGHTLTDDPFSPWGDGFPGSR
jgi:hypothetical protein